MAVSGTGPLKFTDDLMYDDSSRMNLEGYKTILPTNIQENATRFIGKCFILHQDNDPKHPASSVKEFIRANKWKVLDCPSQSNLSLIEHEFHHLKRRVKAETPQHKQQLELAALKAGKSISKDETKSLVMSMGLDSTANRAILSLLFQHLWRALYIWLIIDGVTAHDGAPPCSVVALFPTQHYRRGTDDISNPLPYSK